MRKICKKIHLWLSLPFGIFITLICFSGASLVFEKEITEMWLHEQYFVEADGRKPLSADSLMAFVSLALPDSVEATGLTVMPEADRAWQVSLSKPRRASVFVNPYTGEITGKSGRLPFFDTMFHLHRWLLGSSQTAGGGMSPGKWLVGTSTLVLILILVTGVVAWWPQNRKVLKSRLCISVTKGWARFWYDLHVSAGIYATVFLLALALTGLTWSFGWYRTGFYALFGVEASADASHGGHGNGGNRGGAREGGDRGDRQRGERHRGGRQHEGRQTNDSTDTKHHNNDRPKAVAAIPRDAVKDTTEKRSYRKETADAGNYEGRHRHEDGDDAYGEGRPHRREYGDSTSYEGRRHRHYGDDGDGDSTRSWRHRHHDGEDEAAAAQHRSHESGERRTERAERQERKTAAAAVRRQMKAESDSLQAKTDSIAEDSVATAERSPYAMWQKVLDILAATNPDYRQITLQDGSAGVVPKGRMSLRATDNYTFDTVSGSIISVEPYAEQPKAGKVRGGVYMVHVGTWGGMATRILTFLAVVIGTTLPLTGYYLWIRRLVRKRKDKKRQ
ncbi:MAG: PepSY domain-containing protein [Prevotella sp.]